MSPGRVPGQGLDHQALLVDRHREECRPGRLKGKGRALIAGVFDHRRRPRPEEQARGDGNTFLDAGGDDDLARVGKNAPMGSQMMGQGGAQGKEAARIAILGQALGPAMGQAGLQQAPPGLQGEQGGIGPAGKEIETEAAAGLGDQPGRLRDQARPGHGWDLHRPAGRGRELPVLPAARWRRKCRMPGAPRHNPP